MTARSHVDALAREKLRRAVEDGERLYRKRMHDPIGPTIADDNRIDGILTLDLPDALGAYDRLVGRVRELEAALADEAKCVSCSGDGRGRCICDKQVCTCYVSRDPKAPCHACKGSGVWPRSALARAALGERM